jgi:hypothetical protein
MTPPYLSGVSPGRKFFRWSNLTGKHKVNKHTAKPSHGPLFLSWVSYILLSMSHVHATLGHWKTLPWQKVFPRSSTFNLFNNIHVSFVESQFWRIWKLMWYFLVPITNIYPIYIPNNLNEVPAIGCFEGSLLSANKPCFSTLNIQLLRTIVPFVY